jgi:hypothetical protein
MKFIAPLLAALALLLTTEAKADSTAFDMSFLSAATATTTVAYTTPVQTSMFTTCAFSVTQTGATGGTLDLYLQTGFKQINNPTLRWVDVAHTPQMAAGAAVASYVFTVTRFNSAASTIVASNTTSATPTLAANTTVQGLLGYKFRWVAVSGASTSVGATQTILATCSDT